MSSCPALRLSVAVLTACCSAGLAFATRTAELAPVHERPAALSPRATGSLLQGVARAGDRLVAVGERGIILLSDDHGASWRQVATPVSATLTAVCFPAPRLGWAVGHAGVVLHTADGGETWIRQLDGHGAARVVLAAAERRAAAAADETAQAELASAQRLGADGADKPFLAVVFADERHGTIVGAFGLALHTEDGGRTWESWADRLPNPGGLHLYAVLAATNCIYVAGEQGLFLRSTDGGRTFAAVETPYAGSFFALQAAPGGALILAGLRGHAYHSPDGGETFAEITGAPPVSFSSITALAGGTLVFANQAGQLFISRDAGRSLVPADLPRQPPLTALVEASDGGLVVVGYRGATRLALPPSSAAPVRS